MRHELDRPSQHRVSAGHPNKHVDFHTPPYGQELHAQLMADLLDSPVEVTTSSDNGITSSNDDRSSQTNIDARRQKRFTLTLPIQTSLMSTLRDAGPPSPIRTTAPSITGSEDVTRPTTPSDNNFLTALAAQERKVLELREELVKAEQVLHKLKKEWAIHEVQKKRQDIKRMRSVKGGNASSTSTSLKSGEEDDRSNNIVQEAERRRAMHYNAKSTQRTVFSGSKHARTLSLLSPEPMNGTFPSIVRPDTIQTSTIQQSEPGRVASNRTSHKRVMSGEMQRSKSYDASSDLDLPREVLMRAGRQMATDFKDGLWTFLEDLRQVTVGEEATAPPPGSRQPRMDNPAIARHSGRERRSKPNARPSPGKASKARQTLHQTGRQPIEGNDNDIDPMENPSPKDSAVDFDGPPSKAGELIKVEIHDSPTARKTPKRRSISKPKEVKPLSSNQDDLESWDNWDSPQVQTDKRPDDAAKGELSDAQ